MNTPSIPSTVSHLPRDPRIPLGSGANVMTLPHRSRSEGTARTEAPRKFVAKGHDAQLQEAQHSHLPTTLTMISGIVAEGTVSRRDKYTITLRYSNGTHAGQDEIFYKHAIESVLIVRPLAQQ